jgi:ankyrin repeat protein
MLLQRFICVQHVMTVREILKLEHPPAKVLELLNVRIEGFDAVQWREEETGTTVLHLAIVGRRIKVVKLLLERGCDVNVTDLDGCTPLRLACESGRIDMVKLIMEHGADIHKATFSNTSFTMEGGRRVPCTAIQGITALASALHHGHMEIVTYLLAQGARTNSTALAMAIIKGLVMVKVRHKISKILRQHTVESGRMTHGS